MENINLMTKKWAEDSNWPCFHSAEVDSTNSWAKSDFKLKDRSLYIADHQSDGRGRNQNTWINSSPGDSFLSTWAFKRSAPPPVVLPIRIGYFLFSALKETWPQIPFSLKAPNDILIRGNKCSGVLIEAVTTTSTEIYVGLGINVLSSPEIPDRNVTSLSQELDSKKISFSDWSHFCYALSNNFLNAVQNNDPLLNTTETLLLKSALNLYYDGTLSAIHNDGSMVFKNGDTIPWNNL